MLCLEFLDFRGSRSITYQSSSHILVGGQDPVLLLHSWATAAVEALPNSKEKTNHGGRRRSLEAEAKQIPWVSKW